MKKKILITGGTVFVSKYVAEYFVARGHEVYVLNRNRHRQVDGVRLIEADRHDLGTVLKPYDFDAVFDVNAYCGQDIRSLLDGLGTFGDYLFISSSAVYPETLKQPFREEQPMGANRFWGKYGTDKMEAESYLLQRVPGAYILRPPYLYGPYNNVYREAFVFDCAMRKRKFYLPWDDSMKLQFFHVRDLCRMMESILERKPSKQIFNVGNPQVLSVYEWVRLCYEIVGAPLETEKVAPEIGQRNYFCFHPYEYRLDVSAQTELLEGVTGMEEGLREAFAWYREHGEEVRRKDYMGYLDGMYSPGGKNG